MINDTGRNVYYKQAIEAAVPGKVVCDIGTGTGLLSILAAKAGATKVYSVEMDPGRADFARKIIDKVGLSDKIEVVHKNFFDTDIRADIFISETIGTPVFNEDIIAIAKHATRHGGQFIPGSFDLWLEIYELEQAIENADKINIIEEVGDCAWYFSLLADHFQLIEKIKINFNYDAKCVNHYDLTIIKQKVFLLNDNFKKLIYYNKTLDIKKSFIDILQDLYNEFVNQFGDIWELALTKNIEKLKKRYPQEYTDKKANNRDLQAEQQVFKK
jgi:predicted RNA methylase